MESSDKTIVYKPSIHRVLAQSYSVHFVLFLVGVCLDYIFNLKVFGHVLVPYFGFIFLVLGTFLIVWAQLTSRKLNTENLTKETFRGGPYRYTRTPTNFGLFFLVLGFGMVINAFFVILTSFISFVIAKFVFLEKEEKLLAEKYGAPYLEYKNEVKF